MGQNSGVSVEWLILADAAQVVANKLFLLGGGWDSITANRPFPIQHQMAVALSIRVPWHETNQRHEFELEIATEDGEKLASIGGEFNVGRPPTMRPGQEQRMQIAAGLGLKLEKAGGYIVLCRLNGQEDARTFFNVVAGPGASAPTSR